VTDRRTVKPFFDDLNNNDIHGHNHPHTQEIREVEPKRSPIGNESDCDSSQDNEYAADKKGESGH
jgi:hypothetical protein